MKGVHWIDLGQWPQQLVLIDNKRSYMRFGRERLDGHKMQPFPPAHGGATTQIEHTTKGVLFIIAVGAPKDRDDLAVTLAHEATHAMRWILEDVGEKQPGTETEAYLVGHIVKEGLRALAA